MIPLVAALENGWTGFLLTWIGSSYQTLLVIGVIGYLLWMLITARTLQHHINKERELAAEDAVMRFESSDRALAQHTRESSSAIPWRTVIWLEIVHVPALSPVLLPIYVVVAAIKNLYRRIKRVIKGIRSKSKLPQKNGDTAHQSLTTVPSIQSRTAEITNPTTLQDASSTIAHVPWASATIGPSFMVSAVVLLVLFIFTHLVLPLALQTQPGAARVDHAVNSLLFYKQPMGGALITMDRMEHVQLFLSSVFWLNALWIISTFVRLVYWSELRQLSPDDCQVEEMDGGGFRPWRQWFGAPRLVEPDPSFLRWAHAATALLVLSTLGTLALTMGGIFSFGGTELSIGMILTCSWVCHSWLLRGKMALADDRLQEPLAPLAKPIPGWQDVVQLLQQRHGVVVPQAREESAWQVNRARRGDDEQLPDELKDILSPLIGADPIEFGQKCAFRHIKPTEAQIEVLRKLYPNDVPNVDAKSGPRSTVLNLARDRKPALDGERPALHVAGRNGAGKTTLGLLAATNHVLRYAEAVIFVASSAENRRLLGDEIRAAIDGSPIRWAVNYVVTEEHTPLITVDEGAPIDIVITDMDWIGLILLEELDREEHKLLLERVGLLIVDDAQHYIGVRSEHASLIFARLNLAFARTQQSLGGQRYPRLLVMDNDPSSAATLVTEKFTHRPLTACWPDNSRWLTPYGQDIVTKGGLGASCAQPESVAQGPRRLYYHMMDFINQRDMPLGIEAIITACEQTKVPWFWQYAGDDLMQSQITPYHGFSERYRVDNALDACVVFLEGRYTHTQNAKRALEFAGARYLASHDTDSDPKNWVQVTIEMTPDDERMAFEIREQQGSLHALFENLPIPFVHSASQILKEAHLSAELRERGLELKQIVDVFGIDMIPRLRELLFAQRLHATTTTAMTTNGREFETLVWVHATGHSMQNPEQGEWSTRVDGKEIRLLQKPVDRVDRFIQHPIVVFDPATQTDVGDADALEAIFMWYPGALRVLGNKYWIVRRTDSGARKESATIESADQDAPRILVDAVLEPNRISVPERILTWQATQRLTWHKQYYGALPTRFAIEPIIITGRHFVTRYLDRHDFSLIRRQVYAVSDSAAQVNPDEIATNAILVDIDDLVRDLAPDNADDARDVLRLFNSAVRMCIGQMLPDAEPPVDVTIMEQTVPSTDMPRYALVIFDLLQGGSGILDAFENDGMASLLRLTRLVIERILNHENLYQRYDDALQSVTLLEQMPDENAEAFAARRRGREQMLRSHALLWLNQHLYEEDGGQTLPPGSNYPSHRELGDTAANVGRAWVAGTLGVTDLRWTRLSWRAPHGGKGRSLDFGISYDLVRDLQKTQNELFNPSDWTMAAETHMETPDPSASPYAHIVAFLKKFLPDSIESDDQIVRLAEYHGVYRAVGQRMRPGSEDTSPVSDIVAALESSQRADTDDWEWLEATRQALQALLYEQLPIIDSLSSLLKEWADNWLSSSDVRHELGIELIHLASSMLGMSVEGTHLPHPPMATDDDKPVRLNGPALTLHYGAAEILSAAVLLAALQIRLNVAAGIFVRQSEEGIDVYGALNIGSDSVWEDASVPLSIQLWRAQNIVLPGTSELARDRLVKKPSLSVLYEGERVVAVNLRKPRQISLMPIDDATDSSSSPWYYLPLGGVS